ncbi:MAG: DegQ family serine endoprotease [Nitrospiraceae bacterium]|nr:MAG: DegQ family serine endoprotease [Nitrospiraceae bacterium]
MVKNKIAIGIAVLLIGFLLGGVSFYLLGKITGQQQGYLPFTPHVSRQIAESGKAFSEIASGISPSVVNISTTKVMKRELAPLFDDPFSEFFSPFRDFKMPKKWKEQSLGSGVIVSPDGYIITNNHVVEQADEIRVTLVDKRSFKAKVIGADNKTDVAIVKIDAENLYAVQWGDSDKLQVGEFVLAIGNPYGLSHTVTMGIISAVGRANVGIADYEDFIQTDAAINPGNSGGPLVNTKGELIGINTAIFSRSGGYQGIGFAVPSNMARLVMDQLIQKGKVTRGWLGVTIQEITPELSQKFGLKAAKGALVGDVAKGSPAEKGGLKRGDVILEFNGRKVGDVGNLRNMVAQSKVGADIPMTILRSGKEYALHVTTAELPKDVSDAAPESTPEDTAFEGLAGLNVIELTGEISRQLGLPRDEKGVVVVRVDPGSSVEEAGLRKGDVVQEVDRKKVSGLADYNRIVADIRSGDTVLMFVNRGGKKFYVTAKAD